MASPDHHPAEHAAWLGLLAVLAFIWCFPLGLQLDHRIPGSGAGDNLTFLWDFWWMRQAVDDPGLVWSRTGFLFAPFGVDLTLNTHVAFPAFIGATILRPLPLPAAYNLVILATLFANAACAYLLAFHVTESKPGAAVGAVVFGGSPYVMAHMQGHLNLVSAWGLPLYCVLFVRLLRRPSGGSGVASGCALAVIAYTDYYYFVYALAFSAVWLLVRWLRVSIQTGSESLTRRRAARVVAAILLLDAVVAAAVISTGGFTLTRFGIRISATRIHNELVVGWFLLLLWLWLRYAPRVRLHRQPGANAGRDLRMMAPAAVTSMVGITPLLLNAFELWHGGGYVSQPFQWQSAPPGIDAASVFLGNPYHPLWGRLSAGAYEALNLDPIEGIAWLGIVPAVLLWKGTHSAAARDVVRPWLIVWAVFFLFSLGPFLTVMGKNSALMLPQNLLRLVPLISNARIPGRAIVMVYLALAVIAAVVVAGWTRQRPRTPLVLMLVALIACDYLASPLPMLELDEPTIYHTLAREPAPGAVCELPLGIRDGFGEIGFLDHRVLYYQSIHGRPLLGGFVARMPPPVKQAYLQDPLIATLLRLSGGAPLENQDLIQPSSGLIDDLQRLSVRWVVLNYDTAPPDLTRYVETYLPLQLVERDGSRVLYAVSHPDE